MTESDGEVLSSHPGPEGARWRRTVPVVLIALAVILPLAQQGHRALSSNPTGTTATFGHTQPSTAPPTSMSEANPVREVPARCPVVRRLRLGDVYERPYVEVVLCSSLRTGGPAPAGKRRGASIRFARVVGPPPVNGDQADAWIEVRCPDRACSAPELLSSAVD